MKNFTARVKMMDGSVSLFQCDSDNIHNVEAFAMQELSKEGKHPASVEMVYVTQPMIEPYFVCKNGNEFSLVDKAVWDGTQYKTACYGQTLDELKDRTENRADGTDAAGNTKFAQVKVYANAEVMEWTDAWPLYEAAQRAKYIGPVKQVSKDRFWYLLEVLPPMKWVRNAADESFMMSEYLTGNITTIAVRDGKKYYELNDVSSLKHSEIMDKVREAVKAGTVEDHTADKPLH